MIISMGALLIGSLIAGLVGTAASFGSQAWSQSFNSAEAATEREWQSSENALDRSFNAEEAQKERDWQTEMSNTQYQRAVADMKAAGLNVGALGSSISGSTVSSTAPASHNSGSGASASSNAISGRVDQNAMLKALGSTVKQNEDDFIDAYWTATKSNASAVSSDVRRLISYSYDRLTNG